MMLIEARSSGRSRNVWARGTLWGTFLPYWNAVYALSRIGEALTTNEPYDGVALLIRRAG